GDTWMEGGNINLSGPTTINSNLSVFGTTNTINGTTNNLNGTLNVAGTTTIGGTTTINGTTIINGAFDGDLVHATQLDADALAGDIDGSGYSISNLGQIYGEIFNVSNQLNVANVGGHTMVGDINMNENDILNPFSITGVNVFTTHDATVTGLLNPTQVGGFTMVGGINMNNQDINNVDQADFNQVTADQLVGGMITATTGLIAEDELRIQQGSGPYSAFEANPAQSSNITYTLPAQQGNPGTVLQNNGSGGLGWGTMVHREVVTHNVASIPANSAVTFTLSVNGAPLGSAVYVSPGGDMIGGLFIGHCRVSATDTVEIRIVNMSPNPVDLPSMDWYFGIIR
ncbi:MAG TPA: hypothetical protein VFH43_12575, partial [Candidatus Kapabacteria bacterium]|nr:hypothetical protein [Candidatus Kapabacteria bacterium]